MKLYELNIEGLANQVRLCPVKEKHKDLIALLRASAAPELDNIKLVSDLGGSYKAKRKVVTREGSVVSDDHEKWLHEQLEADGGIATDTFRRIAGLKLCLSLCEVNTLRLMHDRLNDNPADFVQATVYVTNEFVDQELFNPNHWFNPTDERELISAVQYGYSVPAADRLRLSPSAYSLGQIVDVGIFVDETQGLEHLERQQNRRHQYQMTNPYTNETKVLSIDQIDRGWDQLPYKFRRLFDDWANSSAGKSGARFCDYWYVQLYDHTELPPRKLAGQRTMELTHQFNTEKTIKKVKSTHGDDHTFFGKLAKLDRSVKVPFAWYFFMLRRIHVTDSVGKRMLQIAEAGTTKMPECDYLVLKNWVARRYWL